MITMLNAMKLTDTQGRNELIENCREVSMHQAKSFVVIDRALIDCRVAQSEELQYPRNSSDISKEDG